MTPNPTPEEESIESATIGWVAWCERRGMSGLSAHLIRMRAALAHPTPAVAVAQPSAEVDLLRYVYEATRRFLRFNGVDRARASAAVDDMDEAVESVKQFDATGEPTEPSAEPFNAATLAQIAAVRPDLIPSMHGIAKARAQPSEPTKLQRFAEEALIWIESSPNADDKAVSLCRDLRAALMWDRAALRAGPVEQPSEAPRLQFAVFDEFGNGADDRVSDYGYRCMEYGRATPAIAVAAVDGREAALQAKIDALMLEYCPEEMTPEQRENWAARQRPVSAQLQAEIDAAIAPESK